MEFLVEFEMNVPDGIAQSEVTEREQAEASAAAKLTADGHLRSRGVRHGSPEVLARLGRGEKVDPSEYTFRTATQIETAAPERDWLNKGVFISVGGRQPAGVIYDTYLVA